MKKYLVIAWLCILFSAIGYLFWTQEGKYNLPTPVPKNYSNVTNGTLIDISTAFNFTDNKPVFIHFFNPDCPCSRFNLPHVQSLIKQYGENINFGIVVLNPKNGYTEKDIQAKLELDVPVSFDTTVAGRCGVYSTPQAVLLNGEHQLYFRGNYNKSRYCTNKESNYAQMAIDSLLDQKANPLFGKAALQAYGCELPTCTK